MYDRHGNRIEAYRYPPQQPEPVYHQRSNSVAHKSRESFNVQAYFTDDRDEIISVRDCVYLLVVTDADRGLVSPQCKRLIEAHQGEGPVVKVSLALHWL